MGVDQESQAHVEDFNDDSRSDENDQRNNWEKQTSMKSRIQRILPSVIFDVGLPSLDVYSDVSLIIGWFLAGHPIYAWTMTVPVLLQFLSTAYKWYYVDKPDTKRWSWILLLLQCWPQFRALRVIRLLYKGVPKANEKMKKMMNDISSTEPYLEAWPSVMAMTAIWMHALGSRSFSQAWYWLWFKRISSQDPHNTEVLYGDLGQTWFFISFMVSFLTAGLGITKLFLVGPCPILSQEGPINGLCTWRFMFCFLGVLSSMFTKAFFIGVTINIHLQDYAIEKDSQVVELLLCLLLQFVPNLILSTVSILLSTGFTLKFWKIVFDYPGVWLLPAATYYSVGPQEVKCGESAIITN